MALINQIMYYVEGMGWYIIPFVAIMSAIVFFHELGHYLVGRWCGVKIEAFSLGFGPELYARVDKRGTRWRIAAFPLGGYVKFHGDANAASANDAASVAAPAPAGGPPPPGGGNRENPRAPQPRGAPTPGPAPPRWRRRSARSPLPGSRC